MSTVERWLTAEEVAGIIGMSPSWVYAEARARRIPCQRPGRKVLFTRAQVEAITTLLEQRVADEPANVTGLSPRSRRRRRAERLPATG